MINENIDVLIKILLLLPSKLLIRFKLVSKQWLSIISDPHFSHSHAIIHRHLTTQLLFHCPKTSHSYLLHNSKLANLNFSAQLTTPTICSVSNGLLLLRCDSQETAPTDCYVYNPTTRQSRRVSLRVNVNFQCVMGLNIAFDSTKSNHYKIVCVRSARMRVSGISRSGWRRCQIEVYESGAGEWNVHVEDCLLPREMDFDRGVYWNDAVHWRGLFFDLNTNSMGVHPVIKAKPDLAIDCVENYTRLSGGLLCVAHFRRKNLVEVFELELDYLKWSLKFSVPLDSESAGQVVILGIEWNESEEDGKLVVLKSGKLMTYGVRERIFEEVAGCEDGFYENRMQYGPKFGFQFLETLALIE